jgi:hypothetical protein
MYVLNDLKMVILFLFVCSDVERSKSISMYEEENKCYIENETLHFQLFEQRYLVMLLDLYQLVFLSPVFSS